MRVFGNLTYKLVALALACVLWAAAQGFRSVEESIDVPISFEQTPDDVVVVNQTAREINLRLVGSRAALRRAAKELSRYSIPLAGLKPGEARHAVTLDHLSVPRGARVLMRSPSAVVVTLDAKVRKVVPVRADLVGTPPAGFRVASVQVDPAQVELEGARSEVRRIREVLTDRLDVSELRQSLEQDVRLLLGAGNVWRSEAGERVRVRVEIAGPTEGASGPAPGARSDTARKRVGSAG